MKILIGINPKSHLLLANDELNGLNEIGFECRSVRFGRKDFSSGFMLRLFDVITNAFSIIIALYKFSPAILYLNSRVEPIAAVRDFITVSLIKCFYFKRLKVVIKSHGSEPSVLIKNSFLYKRIMIPYLSKHVDAWFFLSTEEKNIAGKYAPVLADKIFVTANIIDPSRSKPSSEFRKKYHFSDDKIKILFIGRTINEKGVFEFLNSIPLTDCSDQCEFIFVGDGPCLQDLKELAIKKGITSYVKFLGWFDEQEADNFYANVDIFVFPTFFDEGFPMALFKSVAAGLPVITTKTRAASDYLSMPENVLWVEAKSEKQVAKAIEELVKNEPLRKSMSANNILLSKQFSRNKICSEMGKVFASLT